MNAWQRISYILMMALFAGATSAAPSALVPGDFSAADPPSQSSDAPPDCKKKPDDPRCGSKPY